MPSVPVSRPARPILDGLSPKVHGLLQSMAGRVAAGANWMVRKKTLCDLMLGLDSFFSMTPGERRAAIGRAPDADEPDDAGPAEPFAGLLPTYVGAILEHLGEERVAGPEQAAIYLLSIQPEHTGAAEAWMQLDPRHEKAVRRIMRQDRRYAALMTLLSEHDRSTPSPRDTAAGADEAMQGEPR
ncbi:hypothetical protein [Azospirillum halopraeferens]|uniref:hypothetical protein n=1 Tax=Azospirillum halopraeferens TaxID=34010 RepID=UPI000408FC13|nr:hypothetical protein [Azospirillum halopraeferens]